MTRERIVVLKFILEELLPPIIRDSHWFNQLLLATIFRKNAAAVKKFQNKFYNFTPSGYAKLYALFQKKVKTPSDLSRHSVQIILNSLIGEKIADIGCGNGNLLSLISKRYPRKKLTGADIVVSSDVKKCLPEISFVSASIEKLPFKDRSFDTVISTHTLEHIHDLRKAVSELRRIAIKRLIIVVPRERPYRHTSNLHLHFFPYGKSLISALGEAKKHVLHELATEIVYIESL